MFSFLKNRKRKPPERAKPLEHAKRSEHTKPPEQVQPPQRVVFPSDQKYAPLPHDGDTVRLVALAPSQDPSATLQCTLNQVKLSDEPLYEALSYTWGDVALSSYMMLDGYKVRSTKNLQECLRRLRKADQVRMLWIDALSINQNDNEEKSQQIQLMPYIYSKAVCVVAWLGEAASGSDELIDFVNENYEYFSGSNQDLSRLGGPRRLERLKSDISDLLDRPYWNRTWIIQELLKAKRRIIVCGDAQIDGDRLERLSEVHSMIGFYGWSSLKLIRSDGGQAPNQGLSDLIQLSQGTKCADSRDRIYALLGLLDGKDPAAGLKPDYSLSVAQLFFRVLKLLPKPSNGEAKLGVVLVLRTLDLSFSKLVTEHCDIDPGYDIIQAKELKEYANRTGKMSFSQLPESPGVRWQKSFKDNNLDRLFSVFGIDCFYLVQRLEKGRWKWGYVWLVPQGELDASLKLVRDFATFFQTKQLDAKIVTQTEASGGGVSAYQIAIPRLLLAAIEIYNTLILDSRAGEERVTLLRREGQYRTGAAAPQPNAPNIDRADWEE